MLVVRSRVCGSTLALVMPSKGLVEEWMGLRVSRAVDSLGHGDIVLTIKTDGEGPIQAVRDAVIRQRREVRGVGSLIEKSARGDHASNGVIEKVVQEVERANQDVIAFRREEVRPENGQEVSSEGMAHRAHWPDYFKAQVRQGW